MDEKEDEGVRDGAMEGREERGLGFHKRFTWVYIGFGNLRRDGSHLACHTLSFPEDYEGSVRACIFFNG
jgi:hypothetical protein